MKIITLMLALISYTCLAEIHNCNFESDLGAGDLKVTIDKSHKAKTKLSFKASNHIYNECKADTDEFGLLIDCSTGNLDFMILLNNNIKPASGGVMSSTHDLFADLDC